jgi:DNA primase
MAIAATRADPLAVSIVDEFKLGWAPDDWDTLARQVGVPADLLRETGLAFENRRGKLQDAFRARILFPIFSENGEPIGLGGRVLPGSDDPAKYKNSPETSIYTKSKTLYGLNWAKAGIVAANQAIVCEGYTDVIGFHRSGLPRAVATCGTAFTEEHVRLLKRYTSRVVLAFDADAAGQGAAERFYEWEQKHQVEVSVARFPGGKDPGDLAQSDPEALAEAVATALPFLGFRLDRVLSGSKRPGGVLSPEQRARLGEASMSVINEHPNSNVRKLYAGQVATELGLPMNDLVQLAERGTRRPQLSVPSPANRRGPRENAEFVAITMLVQNWDSIASWLVEALFADDLYRRAFVAIAGSGGDLAAALESADPEAREIIERAAVIDLEADADTEARNLIAAAVRRELGRAGRTTDAEIIRQDREARLHLEDLQAGNGAVAAAEWLLVWLEGRVEGRVDGGS